MGLIDNIKRAIRGKIEQYGKSMYFVLGNGTMITQSDSSEEYVKDMKRSLNVFAVVEKSVTLAGKIKYRHVDSEEKDIVNSKLKYLIENPNELQSGHEFREQAYAMYNLTGNVFIYAPRIESGNNAGQCGAMYVLPSPYVVINSGGYMKPVESYSLQLGRTDIKFDASDIIHIKKLPIDIDDHFGLYGISPFSAGSWVVSKSKANMNVATKLNSAGMPLGILSTDPMLKDSDGSPFAFNDGQMEQVRKNFEKSFGGSNSRSKILMQSIAMKWQKMGLDYKEMGISEDFWDGIRQVCMLLSVPSVLLNDMESSAFNNVKEATKWVYTQNAIPMTNKFAAEISKSLAEAFNPNSKIIIDTSDIEELQENLKEKSETYGRIGTPINVYLEKMGIDPIPEMNNVLIGSLANFTRVDEIVNSGTNDEIPNEEDEDMVKYFKSMNKDA